MRIIKVNVHQIVDLLLRKGDLDTRFFNIASMQQGSLLHKKYQRKQDSNYLPEFRLKHNFEYDEFNLVVNGIADGIIKNGPKDVTIDEIKTTNDDLDKFYNEQKDWHLGQAMFYAYMYCLDYNLDKIKVQLTYISQINSKQIKQYLFFYNIEQLKQKIEILLDKYIKFIKIMDDFYVKSYESIQELEFPFDFLRKGQEELIRYVYNNGINSNISYVQAKTGIGKTISTIFPSLKVLQEKKLEKIFYLTSKSSIKMVAYNTIKLLTKSGLRCKCVVLTSKEKLCQNAKKGHCNPDECIFAKAYYDKVNEILIESLGLNDLFDSNLILSIALKYEICPYEFQLDLANYCLFIIGDYNYLFDPHAKLVRFFDTEDLKNKFALLIDEAHNLPNRVNEMFSISIKYLDIIETYNYIKNLEDKKHKEKKNKLLESIKSIGEFFIKIKNEKPYSESYSNIELLEQTPIDLIDLADDFVSKCKDYIKSKKIIEDTLISLLYLFQDLLNLPSDDKKWCTYYQFDRNGKIESFNITCIDSSRIIKNALTYFDFTTMFSATLSPKNYFIDLLGGDRFSSNLYLPSSFNKENQLVIVNPFIKTFYSYRQNSIQYIIRCLLITVSKKKGNYLVFFPSYEYMLMFKNAFVKPNDIDIFYQESKMSENQREEFLSHFVKNPTKTTIGVSVLGGVFSEGVDLVEDRLIGTMIISVGMPKISFLNDYIFNYYKDKYDENIAYDYTYTYPGINKIFQASGRVIRTENDKGIIMLVDTRYITSKYQELLNDNFEQIYNLNKSDKLDTIIKAFWEKQDE